MAETTLSGSRSLDTAQRPNITDTAIDDIGLTLLATGGSNPTLDVILVHGLQGHPEHTWTYICKAKPGATKKEAKTSKLKFWKTKTEEAISSAEDKPTSAQDEKKTYWPTRLLAPDLPTARIFTYGYDSHVTHFFNGPANQNTITDNGKALLSSIASQRQDCLERPILLIVHSLGGIVVKSALRISALADDRDTDLKDIYQSTFAILFFGTPHRGSDWTDAGQIARKFAAVVGFSTANYNLRTLQGNTEILEILRDEFARMLGKEAFYITSFQESKGFKGVKGLDQKIVEPDSSGLDHIFERKIPINATHLDMCKFATQGPTRREYDEKVRAEVLRHWRRESKRTQEQQKKCEKRQSVATTLEFLHTSLLWQMTDDVLLRVQTMFPDLIRIIVAALDATKEVNDDCKELLKSLESADTGRRFEQVDKAHSQTFEWLFSKPELGFKSWLEAGTGLYWCRGHPASGKSTLMKWVYDDPRTVGALATGGGRKIKANFFFHDRGSEIQKSFRGLLQGIVYQVLQVTPELLPLILPIRHQILKRFGADWTEEDLHKAFQVVLGQQSLRLDFTLFLDALDEYNGTHESIATFLYSITSVIDTALTKVKICFSSRTLQIFLDKFSDVPGFYIHEHTTEDIRLVIQSRMSQNPRMLQYMQSETPGKRLLATRLATEVSSRAEGIFLWVKLVLDELLDDFTAGETLQGLMKKLVFLPPKLEDFYQHTLNRLPSHYRNDTKVIFEVLRCAIRPLRLHDFFEICRYTRIEKLFDCTPCTATDNEWNHDSVQRWTRSRTGGLVQLVPLVEDDHSLDGGSFGEDYMCPDHYCRGEPIYIVQFLHQTVKTFSQSAGWATTLTEDRFPCHRGYAYIARYILALLFHHPQSDSNVWNSVDNPRAKESSVTKNYFWGHYGAFYLIQTLYSYMSLAESETPKALVSPLVEFGDERTSELFHLGMWTIEMRRTPLTCITALAVVFDLCDLLDELLEREDGRPSITSPPLLHLAVSELLSSFHGLDSKKRSRSIRILLNHGADVGEVFEGYTPYERLCKLIMEGELRGPWLTMVLPFLQTGQDSNTRIRFSKRLSKRSYRSVQQCLLHQAAESADCELIYALLEYGANVNALNDLGSTPLDCVCDGSIDNGSTPQLSELVNKSVQEPSESRPIGLLRRRLQAASLLISRGGRFGVPNAKAVDKFLFDRQPVTQVHIESLKSLGMEVDSRIVRSRQNQVRSGISGFIMEPFDLLKKHVAS